MCRNMAAGWQYIPGVAAKHSYPNLQIGNRYSTVPRMAGDFYPQSRPLCHHFSSKLCLTFPQHFHQLWTKCPNICLFGEQSHLNHHIIFFLKCSCSVSTNYNYLLQVIFKFLILLTYRYQYHSLISIMPFPPEALLTFKCSDLNLLSQMCIFPIHLVHLVIVGE